LESLVELATSSVGLARKEALSQLTVYAWKRVADHHIHLFATHDAGATSISDAFLSDLAVFSDQTSEVIRAAAPQSPAALLDLLLAPFERREVFAKFVALTKTGMVEMGLEQLAFPEFAAGAQNVTVPDTRPAHGGMTHSVWDYMVAGPGLKQSGEVVDAARILHRLFVLAETETQSRIGSVDFAFRVAALAEAQDRLRVAASRPRVRGVIATADVVNTGLRYLKISRAIYFKQSDLEAVWPGNVVAFYPEVNPRVPVFAVLRHGDEVVVVIRGTCSTADALTDFDTYAVHFGAPGETLDSATAGKFARPPSDDQYYAHAGFAISALSVYRRMATELAAELATAKKLTFCGHSMAGAIAALLGVLYAREVPGVQVVSYGGPPSMSAPLAAEASRITTSFVNGFDIVARASFEGVRRVHEHLARQQPPEHDGSLLRHFGAGLRTVLQGLMIGSGYVVNPIAKVASTAARAVGLREEPSFLGPLTPLDFYHIVATDIDDIVLVYRPGSYLLDIQLTHHGMVANHLLDAYAQRILAVIPQPWYWPWVTLQPLGETEAERVERETASGKPAWVPGLPPEHPVWTREELTVV
jgi:hypothetical protein